MLQTLYYQNRGLWDLELETLQRVASRGKQVHASQLAGILPKATRTGTARLVLNLLFGKLNPKFNT